MHRELKSRLQCAFYLRKKNTKKIYRGVLIEHDQVFVVEVVRIWQ